MPARKSPGLFPEEIPVPSSGAPAGLWLNAHCDGGARGNPGPAGYGAVLADDHGLVLAELSEFLGFRTNNFAEYSGLLGCLQWALDHRHPRLRVVSDSELMVKQIQGKYKVNSPDLKPLWEEARRRIARLEAFQITHALRHKNKDADRLANEAMDRGMKRPATPGSSSSPSPAPAATYPQKPPAVPSSLAGVRETPGAGASGSPKMLRGFTRDGVVHILGTDKLPDGIFVKIVPE